jgi:hypothetical protein
MNLLTEAIDILENNGINISICNAYWDQKILNFNIKYQYNNSIYLCSNNANKKYKHPLWNNKTTCHNCICLGNRLYAVNYFYNKIIQNLIKSNYIKNNNKFINFTKILTYDLKQMCLSKIKLVDLYNKITNCFKKYYNDVIIILQSIRNFEENYNPNFYKCPINNDQYITLKNLLELS